MLRNLAVPHKINGVCSWLDVDEHFAFGEQIG